jgi:hypothetical protein
MAPFIARAVWALNDMVAVLMRMSASWATSFSLVHFVQIGEGG